MEIGLFDSHCHLDMEEFRGSVEGVLQRAYDAGVRRVLLAACDEMSSYETIRIAGAHGNAGVEIWAAAGVHPHDASGVAGGLPEELTDLSANRHVVAIGEMGLDYYYDNSPRDVQARVFEWQIAWAKRAKKPIIVHLRNAEKRAEGDAYRDAIRIMKRAGASCCGGVIHCFSGEVDDARAALDLGFYISFAGPITYPKVVTLREAAAFVPLDRILCETDSPYLAPQSRRGKRNEPALVREVYEKMAEVRNIPLDKLAEAVWQNAENLFGCV
ncbi:TatD family hydrolase [Synergistaceae bacterium OttesenSCG-928-I11]|nr:TatD family hydrolase [Synergistaceae bacterium OttesenSCG-928-I11]